MVAMRWIYLIDDNVLIRWLRAPVAAAAAGQGGATSGRGRQWSIINIVIATVSVEWNGKLRLDSQFQVESSRVTACNPPWLVPAPCWTPHLSSVPEPSSRYWDLYWAHP